MNTSLELRLETQWPSFKRAVLCVRARFQGENILCFLDKEGDKLKFLGILFVNPPCLHSPPPAPFLGPSNKVPQMALYEMTFRSRKVSLLTDHLLSLVWICLGKNVITSNEDEHPVTPFTLLPLQRTPLNLFLLLKCLHRPCEQSKIFFKFSTFSSRMFLGRTGPQPPPPISQPPPPPGPPHPTSPAPCSLV